MIREARFEKSKKAARILVAGAGLLAVAACGTAHESTATPPKAPTPAVTTAAPELPVVAPPSEAPTPQVIVQPTYSPHQKLGTLSLTISGSIDKATGVAPLRHVVTTPLEVDGRTAGGQGFNANDPALMDGFMYDSYSNPIGWLPVGAITTTAHPRTVIAGHRITNVPVTAPHGPSYDLPAVENGDTATFTPTSGPRAVYTAIKEGMVPVAAFDAMLNEQVNDDEMIIYGCSDPEGVAGGDQNRTYVILARTE
ncbi:MAG: hypothetical protein JWN38_614 [Candidatus Saccharibacteria bacterium]|nr:hypothetical protein [Candidatus Saccharibacteria bacterium]